MKNNNLLTVLLSVLLVSACGESAKIISEIDTGKLVLIEEIATSFNDSHRSRIVTTKGTFYVNSIVSAMTDSKTWINEYDNGSKYICIEGNKNCKYVVGN